MYEVKCTSLPDSEPCWANLLFLFTWNCLCQEKFQLLGRSPETSSTLLVRNALQLWHPPASNIPSTSSYSPQNSSISSCDFHRNSSTSSDMFCFRVKSPAGRSMKLDELASTSIIYHHLSSSIIIYHLSSIIYHPLLVHLGHLSSSICRLTR